jgi:hypothetical protein
LAVVAVILIQSLTAAIPAAGTDPIDLGVQLELMIDRHLIEHLENVQLVFARAA